MKGIIFPADFIIFSWTILNQFVQILPLKKFTDQLKEQGRDSQNFFRQICKFFLTLRCFYKAIIY